MSVLDGGIDPDGGRKNKPELERLHRETVEALSPCPTCGQDGRCKTTDGQFKKIPCNKRTAAAVRAGWEPMVSSKCVMCKRPVLVPNDPNYIEPEEPGYTGRSRFKFVCGCGHWWFDAP